jgi:ethanolamine utilization microcompartment shell protein EutS
MTINPGEASRMLADIDAVVAKVKQSRGYRIGGAIMILWGVIVVVANLLCATTPSWSGRIWLGLDAIGVAALRRCC